MASGKILGVITLTAVWAIMTVSPSCAYDEQSSAVTGRLENGIDVVLLPNHSVPMTAANIIIRAGARDETWHTWGAAHFLEHLLFNGTVNRSQEDIYAAFDRLGAYHNAHTGSHFTDFMLLTASKHFSEAFPILTDMVFNSSLPAWKFEKERGIVMEEIARSRTHGPDDTQPLREMLFGGGALSRDVLGTVESISRLERDSVLAFYHRWYVPNNMTVFVTGDFNPDTMFSWLKGELASFKPREMPPRAVMPAPDWTRLAARGLTVQSWPGSRRKLFVTVPFPVPGAADYPVASLLAAALDRRFERELPAMVTGGTSLTFDPDLAALTVVMTAPPEGPAAPALDSLLNELLKNLVNKPPSSDEIAALVRRYRADEIFTSEKLHYYGIMYSSWWSLVPWQEFNSWPERMSAATPAALKETAQRLFANAPRVRLALEPAVGGGKEARSGEVVQKRFNGPNGLTTIVRSDPSARVCAVHVLARDRWLYEKTAGVGIVDLMHRLMVQDPPKAARTLTEQLDNVSATLKTCDDPSIPYDDYYTSPDYSFIRLEVLPDNWRDGVKILFDRLASLPNSKESLASAKESASRAQGSSARSPAGVGSRALQKRILEGTSFGASVYGDVAQIELSALEELFKRYYHPSNLIITAVGPFNPDDAGAFIQTQALRLPRGSLPLQELPAPFNPEEAAKITAGEPDTLKLSLAQGALVRGAVVPEVRLSDQAALLVANAWLNDRMGEVLREQRGLAYSLGSSISIRRSDDSTGWGWWEMSISTRAENLPAATAGFDELIAELRSHVFTAAEVSRISSAVTGRLLMREMPRIGQAYSMGIGELFWENPDQRATLIDGINRVEPEAVREAVERYLTTAQMHSLIVQ